MTAYGRSATPHLFRSPTTPAMTPCSMRRRPRSSPCAKDASLLPTCCQDERERAQALRLYLKGLACLARHEQSGRRRLRYQAVGHARLVVVARLLPLVPARLPGEAPRWHQLAREQRDAAQHRAVPVEPSGDALYPLSQGRPGVRARHDHRRLLYRGERLAQAHHRQPRDGRASREGVPARRSFRRAPAVRPSLRTGLVVALEDSIVLFIAQKAFTRLARAFPILDAYFKEY